MADHSLLVPHPPGFRARRGLNWTFVGLLYTSFYTCRYNLAIANKSGTLMLSILGRVTLAKSKAV